VLSLLLTGWLGTAPLTVADGASGASFVLRIGKASFCALYPTEYSGKTDCAGFDLVRARTAFDKPPADPRLRTVLIAAGDAEPSGELFVSVIAMKVGARGVNVPELVADKRREAEGSNGKLAAAKAPEPMRLGTAPACSYTIEYAAESSSNALEVLVAVSPDTVLDFSFRGPASTLALLKQQRDTLIADLRLAPGKRAPLLGCGGR
jgi:hypothetical protein